MTQQSFRDALRASAPTPHDESEGYRKFSRMFSVGSIFGCLAVIYGFCFLYPDSESLTDSLQGLLPFLEHRTAFLRDYDFTSYVRFGSTVLGFGFAVLAMLSVMSFAYWRTVVRRNSCASASLHTLLIVALSIMFSFVMFYILFVYSGEPVDYQRPGMSRILCWPLFPFIASLACHTISHFLFGAIVGLMKFSVMVLRYEK